MPEDDDLPQDLTFTDPAITTRPMNLPHEPRPDSLSTPMQKIRDALVGLLLLGGFLAALYAFSKLILSNR
jgi:hypothetical protein